MVSAAIGQNANEPVIPAFVRYSGTLSDVSGDPLTGTVEVTFSPYKEQRRGAALRMESQKVEAASGGNYTVALGLTTFQGLPASLFVAGEARWLGVQIAGQAEQPRVMLLAVPYAMKAGDAATLGGMPPSAFMMAGVGLARTTQSETSVDATAVAAPATPASSNVTTTGGTVNAIPLFTTASDAAHKRPFCVKCGADLRRVGSPAGPGTATGVTAISSAALSYATRATKCGVLESCSGEAKLDIAALAIIFVGGSAGVVGMHYVVHRVTQKIHETADGILGSSSDMRAISHGEGSGSGGSESRRSAESGTVGDTCRLLSKQDVSKAIGVEIVQTHSEDDGAPIYGQGHASGNGSETHKRNGGRRGRK